MDITLPTPRRPISLKELTKLNGLSIKAVAWCQESQNEEFTVPEGVTCLFEERVTGFSFFLACLCLDMLHFFFSKRFASGQPERGVLLNSRFGRESWSGINFERSKMWGLE